MQFLLECLDDAPFDLKAAIQAQVERIVSARIGPADDGDADLPQFGMPSVVELDATDRSALEVYGKRLCRLLAVYEPRLLQPRVELMARADALSPSILVISGTLDSGGGAERFVFPLSDRSAR